VPAGADLIDRAPGVCTRRHAAQVNRMSTYNAAGPGEGGNLQPWLGGHPKEATPTTNNRTPSKVNWTVTVEAAMTAINDGQNGKRTRPHDS